MEYIPLEKPLADLEMKLIALKQISSTKGGSHFTLNIELLESKYLLYKLDFFPH